MLLETWGKTHGGPRPLYSSPRTASSCVELQLVNTRTHPLNSPLSRTTLVSRYQNGKTKLDFTKAKDSERQWHQLGHTQVCTSLQTDNHTSTPPLSFYRPDAISATQSIALKH